MTVLEQLDPLRLYTPAEVAQLLGTAVTESWVKAQARQHPELTTRFTGRKTMLFTASQVALLRGLITGQAEQAPDGPARPGAAASSGGNEPATDLVGVGVDAADEPPPAVAPRPFRSLHADS